MATPAIGWPYALAKRFKAYAVVYASAEAQRIIARGGRIAADAFTHNGEGDYTLAISPPLQNDGASILVSLNGNPHGEPVIGMISAEIATTKDAVNVHTADAAGDPLDMSFTVWVGEALVSEKIANWPGPN